MPRLNPAELEIDLFCKGVRLDGSCTLEQDARSFSRTRAGLGDGLEMVVESPEKRIWLNAPVFEGFAQGSPYLLKKEDGRYAVLHEADREIYPVSLPPAPAWYGRKTSRGTDMTHIGVLQGTYLGIYLGNTCAFWDGDTKLNCKFCTTGLNVGKHEVLEKSVEDVVEVARAAKAESGITFVHFNSGWQRGRGLNIAAPYVKALKEQAGVFVGLQAIPAPRERFAKYDWLIDCGVDHFSFCYELHNPKYFADICPGKEKFITQQLFFDAMEYTSRKLGKGRVSGEIIAGIEPIEDTLRAVEYITSIGAFPTVCIFRPVPGADMESSPSPAYEDMRRIFAHVYACMRKNGIPMGIIPNIEVSLVVNPDDTKFLAPRDAAWHWYDLKLKALKILAKPIVTKQLRPRPIAADAARSPLAEENAPAAGAA
jgi:hypothetical protein